MVVAVAISGARLSPVFDVTQGVRLVEIQNSQVMRCEARPLQTEPVAALLGEFHAWSVQCLICGAIPQPMLGILLGVGIQVEPFVAGCADAVEAAFIEGTLSDPSFSMPGCRLRKRGSCGAGGCGRAGPPETCHQRGSSRNRRGRQGRKRPN